MHAGYQRLSNWLDRLTYLEVGKPGKPDEWSIFSDLYSLRPVLETDWPAILELAAESDPHRSRENMEWLSHLQQFPKDRYPRRHYLVSSSEGELFAYGSIEDSENGWFRFFLVMDPFNLINGPADLLYNRLMMDLREPGAQGAWAIGQANASHFVR